MLVLMCLLLSLIVAVLSPGIELTKGLTMILAILVIGFFKMLGISPKNDKLKEVSKLLDNEKEQ